MKRQEMVFDPFQLLDKKDRKQLTRRNDWIGLGYLGGHLGAIGVSGTGIYLTAGTLFMIPIMFVHGILLACLFAPMHECSHGTAFRTRRLNEAVYWFVSSSTSSSPPGTATATPSITPTRKSRGWTPRWCCRARRRGGTIANSSSGGAVDDVSSRDHQACVRTMRPQDSWYVPKQDLPRIYGEARLMLVVYGTVAGLAVYFGSFAPLIYWIIPRIMGEPLQRAWRIAEHKGCDEGTDVRTNTRSTKAGAVMRRLCWNMPYHSEHHVCPQVPFFALPKLNRLVGHELKPMGESLWAVDKEVRRTCIVSEGEAASHPR